MLVSRVGGHVNRAVNASAGKLRVLVAVLLSSAAAATALPATAAAAGGYANPFRGVWYLTGRTDMGVDFCLSPGTPIRAIGNAVVTGITRNWFRHQPYVWYRLISGRYAGRYIYVAEQITRLAAPGTWLRAGQPVAYYSRSGTCIEMGWSAASGRTLAQATTGYHEAQITPAGVSFASFLSSLGVAGRSS